MQSFRALGLYRKVEFEFGWQFFLRVESVGEVDTTDTTVGVDLMQHTAQSRNKSTEQLTS